MGHKEYPMPSSVTSVLSRVLAEYALAPHGIHGIVHWARVFENGVHLAELTGADMDVVKLFAVLHDSKRRNDDYDPEHGPRAAEFARQIRGDVFDLPDHEFNLLCIACEGHTDELTHSDITVQACWDADRLDLGRVGITPRPSRLCTNVAKLQETIDWAHNRSCNDHVPDFVARVWRIETSRG